MVITNAFLWVFCEGLSRISYESWFKSEQGVGEGPPLILRATDMRQMTITREKNWIVAWAPKAAASDGRQDSTGRCFLLSARYCKGAFDQWDWDLWWKVFAFGAMCLHVGARGQGRKRCRTRGQAPVRREPLRLCIHPRWTIHREREVFSLAILLRYGLRRSISD